MGQGVLPPLVFPCGGHAVERIQVVVVAVHPRLGAQRIAQCVTDDLRQFIQTDLARETVHRLRVLIAFSSHMPVVFVRPITVAIVRPVLDVAAFGVHPWQGYDVVGPPDILWRFVFRCLCVVCLASAIATTACAPAAASSSFTTVSAAGVPIRLLIQVVGQPFRDLRQVQFIDELLIELRVEVLETSICQELDLHHRFSDRCDSHGTRFAEIPVDNFRIQEDVVDLSVQPVQPSEYPHVFLIVERQLDIQGIVFPLPEQAVCRIVFDARVFLDRRDLIINQQYHFLFDLGSVLFCRRWYSSCACLMP